MKILGNTLIYGKDTLSTTSNLQIYDGNGTPSLMWDWRNDGSVFLNQNTLFSFSGNLLTFTGGIVTINQDSGVGTRIDYGIIGGAVSSWGSLSHSDHNTSTNYGFAQGSDGSTHINSIEKVVFYDTSVEYARFTGSLVSFFGTSAISSETISLQARTLVQGEDTLSTSTALEIYDGDTTPTKLWDFRNNGDVYSSGTGVIYGAITVDSGGNTPFTIRRNNSSVNNSLFFPQQLKNSSGSYVNYSQFATKILTNTASSESGQFTINLINNGSNVAIFDSNRNTGTVLNVSHSTGQKFAVSGFITIDSTGQTTIEGGGTRTLAVKRANTTGSTGIHFDNSSKTAGEIYTSYAGGNATNMTFALDNGSGLTTIFQLTPTSIVLSKDLNGNGNRILNTIVNPTVQETTSTATLTINADTENYGILTAMAVNTTIASPTGTPVQGQKLMFRFKDDGTSRTLTWNAIFRAIGVILPLLTIASKTLYVSCIYNSTDTKWDVIDVKEEI